MEFRFQARQVLARSRERVFPFFADAANLGRITPPELGFRILTPLPIEMAAGTIIDYRIRLALVPLAWRTEITQWDPPHVFVDVQRRGPYAQWIHRHTFTDLPGGRTLMEDEVRYRLPFGPLGRLVHPPVRREIERTFAHRRAVVATLFGKDEPTPG